MPWSANNAEKNLAKATLGSLRGMPQTTEVRDVARACRRVLDGKATKADIYLIRNYRGISRSGAGQIRSSSRAIIGLGSGVSAITRDVELAGSGSMTAQARVASTIADNIGMALQRNRKAVIAVGETVAKAIRVDPKLASQFVFAMGRVARLGGAVGMVGSMVAGAGIKYYDTLESGQQAESNIRSTWWRLNNRSAASAMEAQARTQIENERRGSAVHLATNAGGIGILQDMMQAWSSEKVGERFERMAKVAEANRSLRRSTKAVAEYQGKGGTPWESLTEREVNSYLDAYRRKRRIGGLTVEMADPLEPTDNERQAFFESKRQDLRMGSDAWWAIGLNFQELAYQWNPEASRGEWEMQLRERKTRDAAAMKEYRRKREQARYFQMTPVEKRDLDVRRQESLATSAQYRSMHQLVIPD
jgi:hypothetical protein